MVPPNKKGIGAVTMFLVALLLLAAVVAGFMVGRGGSSSALSVGDNGGAPNILQTTDTSPDLTIKAYDAENAGTALTGATNIYRKKGTTAWTAFTAGTAITNLEPNGVYEGVMGISSSDFIDNDYGSKFEVTVPVQESFVIEKAMYDDDPETALTATFYNTNHDASAQTFAAGAVKTVYLKWEASNENVFGNPLAGDQGFSMPNVLCLNLNSTAFDSPQSVKLYPQGDSLAKVSTPQRHSTASTAVAYCYEAPAIFDDGQEFAVRIDADDSNAPTIDDTAYLYAGNWYVNAETGAVDFGVETEEGSAVGTDTYDSLTLDWT